MMKRVIGFFMLFIFFLHASGQDERKKAIALRISADINIDGMLDEPAWKKAFPARNFFQYEPYNGREPSQPTVVKILYDNKGLYVGAMIYDSSPDSILTELGIRDAGNLNADVFTIDITPYDDGQNAYEFRITASGVQGDSKYASGFHDQSWDAVWKSAVSITDSGWIAEIEIPYSALRFPKEKKQEWGLNFWRNIRRYREWSTWSYINNKQENVFNQSGLLTGLNDIKPPLRLSFVPYLAGYAEKNPGNEHWSFSYNYGMDVKLGLTESFTLDATLIPDFGQVESDDVIVDLSPFEIYYQEKRPFFTEGTELFDRGGIFYSRRIGGTPTEYYEIRNKYNAEDIIKNPEEIQLINASKISGRTNRGLGIGVFNAVTSNTFAEVRDSTGNKNEILTEPATNYNMLVLDQSISNNSYVSLYNTNVYRGRNNHTANVTGTEFRLTEKRNMYSVFGRLNISQKYDPNAPPESGFLYHAEISKISGNFRFELWQNSKSDTYDPNDLGFLRKNNEFSNGGEIEYNLYDPFWKLISLHNEISVHTTYLYAPREYSSLSVNVSSRATWKNYLTTGIDLGGHPERHDYFEPRIPGRKVIYPSGRNVSLFFSPDYRKRFVVDLRGGYWRSGDYDQHSYNFSIAPRLRINDHLFFKYNFSVNRKYNDLGYVTDSINSYNEDVIIFGKRNINIISNVLDASYIFTPRSSLTLRLRHYWFTLAYKDYYDLDTEGHLHQNTYTGCHDYSFNAFNIDMVFTWEFAPGSELLFVYKNKLEIRENEIPDDFFTNFRGTFDHPMINSFSIKVMYYLDYQYLKKRKGI